jgi:ComF family protein
MLMLKKFLTRFWNAFFPARCISCGAEDSIFCALCREKIPERGSFDYNGIFSLWEYGHPAVRSALLSLKYKNKRTIADDIAESLHDALFEPLAEKSMFNHPASLILAPYMVIPIPLSKKRFKERGYNQSELLAKALVRQNPLSFILETRVLYKIKDTKTQVSVRDRAKRLQNVRGSFAVKNPEKIHGKAIIIIDDIITTGATLEEARRMLLKAGAKRVYGVTVAH